MRFFAGNLPVKPGICGLAQPKQTRPKGNSTLTPFPPISRGGSAHLLTRLGKWGEMGSESSFLWASFALVAQVRKFPVSRVNSRQKTASGAKIGRHRRQNASMIKYLG